MGMRVVVVGAGFVGFANALVLARGGCEVVVVDVDAGKVDRINRGVSVLEEVEAVSVMAEVSLSASAVLADVVAGAEGVVVATPTDYDPVSGRFDTSSVEECARVALSVDPGVSVVVRSTVPVGFTEGLRVRLGSDRIVFVPEFLREGHAVHDCLYPSRVVVGDRGELGQGFAQLLTSVCAHPDQVQVVVTGSREAEAVKLFANSYLALRVAYFNEVDTFALSQGLDAGAVIAGIGLDPRIGDFYNNPSFGYGGYCLPKDTKQLEATYEGIPQNLISAVVRANETRQSVIAADVLSRGASVVGVHRLIMKAGSDNFRSSSVFGVIERLRAAGATVIVFEPSVGESVVAGCEVVKDLDQFKRRADVIVTNRRSADLADVDDKVYTRDLYGRD